MCQRLFCTVCRLLPFANCHPRGAVVFGPLPAQKKAHLTHLDSVDKELGASGLCALTESVPMGRMDI